MCCCIDMMCGSPRGLYWFSQQSIQLQLLLLYCHAMIIRSQLLSALRFLWTDYQPYNCHFCNFSSVCIPTNIVGLQPIITLMGKFYNFNADTVPCFLSALYFLCSTLLLWSFVLQTRIDENRKHQTQSMMLGYFHLDLQRLYLIHLKQFLIKAQNVHFYSGTRSQLDIMEKHKYLCPVIASCNVNESVSIQYN